MPTTRVASWRRLALLAVPWSLAACADGTSPTDVEIAEGALFSAVRVLPSFATAATGEAVELSLARLTARSAQGDSVVAQAEIQLDPAADQWVLEISIPLAVGRVVSIRLDVELASRDAEGDIHVEWAGQTNAFEATAGGDIKELRLVSLYRGPLDNLTVATVELDAPSVLVAGQWADLDAEISGGGPGAQVFYSALDPTVLVIDERLGEIRAVSEGSARIVASAGPASDTVHVTVSPPFVEDIGKVSQEAAPSLDDSSGRITAALSDGAGGSRISARLSALGAALGGGDPAAAVTALGDAIQAWVDYGKGDSNLRYRDGPELSLIMITLIHVADALGVPFN